MPSWASSLCLACAVMIPACAGAWAQAPEPAPLYDPRHLPAFYGTVAFFTLTPRGDIDGFLLANGTEVKTPPHLTSEIAAAIKPGDRVAVYGLKAASLPLIQAMSIENEATHRAVVDAGAGSARVAPRVPVSEDATPLTIRGRLRQLLHGPRGDVDGALLEDGTVLKLPPPEALRFNHVLAPGRSIEAEGIRMVTPVGSFVSVTALGPPGGPLQPISGGPAANPMSWVQPRN